MSGRGDVQRVHLHRYPTRACIRRRGGALRAAAEAVSHLPVGGQSSTLRAKVCRSAPMEWHAMTRR